MTGVQTCALPISRNGNILAKVAAPESLAVLFNPARNEAYVTHRQAGKVSVIDAKSYKVVKTFDTPTHPNSLALSADGKTLYVSVKQKSTKQQEATQPDDVIRIAQICGNEETFDLQNLYRCCEIARKITLKDEWRVGRVIARQIGRAHV